MLETLQRAIDHASTARSYEQAEYLRAELALYLGGSRLADILHRSAGFPSAKTVRRHAQFPSLASSAHAPSVEELSTNIGRAFPGPLEVNTPPDGVVGAELMADELAVEKRLRYDPEPSNILGICREHSASIPLEFTTLAEAEEVLYALQEDRCHLASEVHPCRLPFLLSLTNTFLHQATVIAIGPYTENRQEYASRVIAISGTCKEETVEDQQALFEQVLKTFEDVTGKLRCRLYCLATDGDSRRRRAYAAITMKRLLSSTSPIYKHLSRLSLFNLLCGDDDMTNNCDPKHIIKRFRSIFLRAGGIYVNGTIVTISTLESHLTHAADETSDYKPLSRQTAKALLYPEDKQDVLLALRLLRAIIVLPEAPLSSGPGFFNTRRVLRLLGRFLFHFLEPYTNVDLTLAEQLTHISTAGHLMLAMYPEARGKLIPSQLYFDLMIQQKSVHFSVAKTVVDNPDSSFYLCLVGTDRLETTFHVVRTITGNDVNTDLRQLSNRIGSAMRCGQILAEHPEWDRTPQRLQLQSLSKASDDFRNSYDHINPAAWKGDTHVRSVNLHGCWQRGLGEGDKRRQRCSRNKGPLSHLRGWRRRRDTTSPVRLGTTESLSLVVCTMERARRNLKNRPPHLTSPLKPIPRPLPVPPPSVSKLS